MNHLMSCYERRSTAPSTLVESLPRQNSSLLSLTELQEFLHRATAEPRIIYRELLSIGKSQKTENPAAGDLSNSPRLEFSMCYDAQRSTLQVFLLRISGVVIPRCRVKVILGDKVRTSKFPKECEGELTFDETLEFFQIPLQDVSRHILYLQTYTCNTLSVPSFAGSVWLSLNDADIYGSRITRAIDKNCKQIMEISAFHIAA